MRRWSAEFREIAGDGAFEVVLDAGSGTGRFVPILGDSWRSKVVVALDLSSAMLRYVAKADGMHVYPVRASLSHLPFDSATFDACLCSMVLHYVAEPAQVCRQIGNVLRPGGVLCVRTGSLETLVSFDFLRYFPTALAAEMKVMPKETDAVSWLVDAGYRDVSMHRVLTPPTPIRSIARRGFPSMQAVAGPELVRGLLCLVAHRAWKLVVREKVSWEVCLLIAGKVP